MLRVKTYYNLPELQMIERRKRKFITLAVSLHTYLKYLYEELDIEQYRFSHMVEDMLTWIVSDKDRLYQFIQDNYEIDEGVEVVEPPDDFKKKIQEAARMVNEGVPPWAEEIYPLEGDKNGEKIEEK